MTPSGKAALFNSPFEVGFRATVLLAELYPASADLQRLVFLDYLLIHSGDVKGPPSLHPPTPFRAQEYAIRRDIQRQGLLIMAARNLVNISITREGIDYAATEATVPFLDRLVEPYKKTLTTRAEWVVSTFGNHSVTELSALFSDNVGRWGSEFVFMRDFSEELSLLDKETENGLQA